MQTEITLSSIESEYTGLPYVLREFISTMQILKDLKRSGFPIESTTPKVTCRVFKYNSGSLEIATANKNRARTKHINIKLHNFIDYVPRGEVTILPTTTLNHASD